MSKDYCKVCVRYIHTVMFRFVLRKYNLKVANNLFMDTTLLRTIVHNNSYVHSNFLANNEPIA